MNIFFKSIILTVSIILIAFFFAKQFDDARVYNLKKEVDIVLQDNLAQQALNRYILEMGSNPSEYCLQLEELIESQSKKNLEISRKVKEYEKKNVFNEEYDFLKRSYYIGLIDMYVSSYQIKRQCNNKDVLMAFFYTIEETCDACIAQGHIIMKIIDRCKNVRVFSFPVDGNDKLPLIFANRYSIKSTPSIVINDSQKFEGILFSEKELIDLLVTNGAVCD